MPCDTTQHFEHNVFYMVYPLGWARCTYGWNHEVFKVDDLEGGASNQWGGVVKSIWIFSE